MLPKDPNQRVRLAFMARLTANLLAWIVIGIALVRAMPASAQPFDYLGRDGTPITVSRGNSPVDHTCNAVVFSQIPGQIDLFVGRARDYAPPGSPSKCQPNPPPGRETIWLALYKMDWQAHTLSYLYDVLRPPVEIAVSAGRTALIKNAYDPSVISFNGELWVAFECGGAGLRGSSSCIAPLDPRTHTVNDPRRISLLVEGGPAETGYTYSSSVPNLFVFRNRVYVYWTAIQADAQSKKWLSCAVRAMQLVQDSADVKHLWGAGSVGQPVPSYQPSLNIEVLGLNPSDPGADQCIDLKGVFSNENEIYLAAGLGGKGPEGNQNCLNAGGGSYGCFRLQIFRASQPLGSRIFNRQELRSPKLPLNPTAYDRFFIDNHGQLSILGYFFPPHRDYTTPYLLAPGMRSFPVNLSALDF